MTSSSINSFGKEPSLHRCKQQKYRQPPILFVPKISIKNGRQRDKSSLRWIPQTLWRRHWWGRREKEGEVTLPMITKWTELDSQLFTGTQTFTRAPGRYTEATLVKNSNQKASVVHRPTLQRFQRFRIVAMLRKNKISLPYLSGSYRDRIPRKKFCTDDWLQIHCQCRRRIR